MLIKITHTVPAQVYVAEINTDEIALTKEELQTIEEDPKTISEYIDLCDPDLWELQEDDSTDPNIMDLHYTITDKQKN